MLALIAASAPIRSIENAFACRRAIPYRLRLIRIAKGSKFCSVRKFYAASSLSLRVFAARAASRAGMVCLPYLVSW